MKANALPIVFSLVSLLLSSCVSQGPGPTGNVNGKSSQSIEDKPWWYGLPGEEGGRPLTPEEQRQQAMGRRQQALTKWWASLTPDQRLQVQLELMREQSAMNQALLQSLMAPKSPNYCMAMGGNGYPVWVTCH